MKNLILKMVAKSVISSEEGNRLMNARKNIDPLWRGLNQGYIDEKKLATFYEHEGYPVIYEEGKNVQYNDYFSRFFTPDIIAKYLVFPISFKKENKDIIIGFISSAHLDSVRTMIQMVFPDFNTTCFHVPYSIFRKIVYRDFMFDIDRYLTHVSSKENQNSTQSLRGKKGEMLARLREKADQAFIFTIENETVVLKDNNAVSRFPLISLPTIKEGLDRGYVELTADSSIKRLSHTEKIIFFSNMGIKREDRITILYHQGDPFFFFLVNAKASKKQLESLVNA